jgi:hypothetical protein
MDEIKDKPESETADDAEPEYSLSDMRKYLDKQWHPGATQTAAKLRELAAENAQLRAELDATKREVANLIRDQAVEIARLHGLLWEIVRDPQAAYSGDWLERVGEALPCQEKAS